jgi:hypothetical protein
MARQMVFALLFYLALAKHGFGEEIVKRSTKGNMKLYSHIYNHAFLSFSLVASV